MDADKLFVFSLYTWCQLKISQDYVYKEDCVDVCNYINEREKDTDASWQELSADIDGDYAEILNAFEDEFEQFT